MDSKVFPIVSIVLAVIAAGAIMFAATSWSKLATLSETGEALQAEIAQLKKQLAQKEPSQQNVAPQSGYSVKKAGVSFTYPAGYTVMEDDGEVTLLKNGESFVKAIVSTMDGAYGSVDELAATDGTFNGPENKGKSLNPDLFYELGVICAADGVGVSITCAEKPESKKMLTFNGLTVYEYYVKQIEENFNDKTSQSTAIGPVYVFDVTQNFNDGYAHALTITPNGEIFTSGKNTQQLALDIASIAQSIKRIPTQ